MYVSACRTAGLAALALTLVTAGISAAPHSQYQVIDLGVLTVGGYPVTPSDVNLADQTVGMAVGTNTYHRAFLHELGVMRDLGAGTLGSVARRINERGEIIGTFGTEWDNVTQGRDHAFHYRDGALTDLSVRFNRYIVPNGINKRGHMVGIAATEDPNVIVSFILRAGVLELGSSEAVTYMDINDRDQITGFVASSGGQLEIRPAIFQQGTTRLLPLPRGVSSAIATRINNRGTVIGYTTPAGTEARQGFVYSGGKTVLVRPLPGDEASFLSDVNNDDLAVGHSSIPDGRSRAIVWRRGSAKDLNALVPRRSGWQLAVAFGINDGGVIVGSGLYDDEYHGFMLLP